MNGPHFEEDTPSVNLLNIEVARLLFTYLSRYRRHLLGAVALVAFITAGRLIVPWISGVMVDRYLVKKGFTVSTTSAGRIEGSNAPLAALLKKGAFLDDSTRFLFRSDFGRFSSHEVARLKHEGVLSTNEYLLIRPAAAPSPAVRAKLSAGINSGVIRGFADGTYLFSDNASARFTAREMILLRADDWRRVVELSLIVIALFLIQFFASYRQIIELMKLSQYAMRDLRAELYRHILSLELSYFDRNPVGRLVNRVSNDIETLNELFSTVVVALFQDLLSMIGIVAVMFFTNVKLAIAVTASFPFLAVITVVFRAQSRSAYRLIRTRIAHLNAFLNENISGMRIIQIFRREASQFAKFGVINRGVYDANVRQLTVFAVFRPLIDLFRWAVVAAVIFFGSQALVHAAVSYGIIVMFLAYIASLFEPLGDLAEKFDVMQSANAAGEKILTVLKADAVREIDGPPAPPAPSGPPRPARFRGEIVFENVWAAYTPGEWVLRDVSFSVPPRSTLGDRGRNRVGQDHHHQPARAPLSMAERPHHGRRRRPGDHSLRATAQQDGGGHAGDVPLLPHHRGEPHARRALRRGALERGGSRHAHRPAPRPARERQAGDGHGTRGDAFGGERQLCAFTRALYADPSILVLDEATSNIDSETEHLIQDALNNLIRNRTSIVVAHRLSTVRNADRIIVIDKGTIAEEGDHASLIGRKGLYYELYKLQFETV